MSLKLFFNRQGKIPKALLLMGWVLSLILLIQLPDEWQARGAYVGTAYLLFVFLALLVTLTRFKPWYKPEDRGHGIEEHFEKNLVPVSYILLITNLIYLFCLKPFALLVGVIALLGIIQLVNFILIYFHWKDADPTPPSYFARSLYRK